MLHKFKVGDKVRVVSQGWNKASLVGQTGTITYIKTDTGYPEYLVCFDNWFLGHSGHGCIVNNSPVKNNCWFLGDREEDEMVKVNRQLEFDFGK